MEAGMQTYSELKVIGRTASSTVSAVEGSLDKKIYALKSVLCLPAKAKKDQLVLAYAAQEARLMMKFSHRNIVAVFDFFVDAAGFHMVQEYCSGGSIRRAIDQAAEFGTGIDERMTKKWTTELMQALDYMHNSNVIHRDIKPENLLLSGPELTLKVGDLGAARVIRSKEEVLKTKPTGTKEFMAPEVAKQQSYTSKADLWSAGLSLCQLMPPGDQTMVRNLAKQQTSVLSPPGKGCVEMKELVASMLLENPVVRASARQVLDCMHTSKSSMEVEGRGGELEFWV
mmetsp:Transcript_44037/g.68844  ORF Transcript_44037/g.68844 Transcript_44037/m.68844 type:complete len:284 (-) Transcript_44037:33-884(-)